MNVFVTEMEVEAEVEVKVPLIPGLHHLLLLFLLVQLKFHLLQVGLLLRDLVLKVGRFSVQLPLGLLQFLTSLLLLLQSL